MKFTKIKTSCDCLSDAKEDTSNKFIRKVYNTTLKDRDFRPDYLKGKDEVVAKKDGSNCKDVCDYYSISIDIWSEEHENKIIEKAKLTLDIAKKSKNYICIFDFKPNVGLVKFTPNQKDGYNEFHYDFYREDSIEINKIDLAINTHVIKEI